MGKETVLKSLENAVQFERDAYDYYSSALEKTRNPDAKNMFEILIEEEKKHAEYLTFLKNRLESRGELDTESTVDLDRDFKRLFLEQADRIDDNVKVESSEIEALSFAIDMERKGMDMYKDLAEKASTDEEKHMFSRLADWEKGHMEFIQDYYDYFQDHGMFTDE